MQVYQNMLKRKEFFWMLLGLLVITNRGLAQVNTVEFGKNRVQFNKFKWKYYQTQNFNTYFYENGQPLAKYVAQIAEKELPSIEQFVEYGLQRRANLVLYNSFNDMEQSNIGLSMDWQTTGGITKLVNNKVVLYSTDDQNKLRIQVRQGIAKILLENVPCSPGNTIIFTSSLMKSPTWRAIPSGTILPESTKKRMSPISSTWPGYTAT